METMLKVVGTVALVVLGVSGQIAKVRAMKRGVEERDPDLNRAALELERRRAERKRPNRSK